MSSRELDTTTAAAPVARITGIATAVDRPGQDSELAYLAPAAAATLRLLADAVKRGADQDAIVQALIDAEVPEAFAEVLDAASGATSEAAGDDGWDFDDRLRADNLAAAASDIRRAFLHI
ncbi:hypothetical protein [Streptomyces sp. NPDC088733]|uniref:hypothetical protein n=1 Tax=Streptomyces sp. NPDC088733 TaxID=3365880 RepID=UPI0038181122